MDNTNMDCVESKSVQADPTSSEINTMDTSENVECHLQNLPLEIITKIVKHLSIKDLLTLTNVSKIWRCNFLNQNVIWKNICEQLNLQDEDYANCVATVARHNYDSRRYVEFCSTLLFGSYCKWWTVYCRYNMILKNIKNNDFPMFYIPCRNVDQSFCTDDYIVNVYRRDTDPIEMMFLRGGEGLVSSTHEKTYLPVFDLFASLLRYKGNTLKIAGNKRFLVFEIHSVIFVYAVGDGGKFASTFQKIVVSSADQYHQDQPCQAFIESNYNTKIDLCDDKLALVHPHEHRIFLVDLTDGKVVHEIEYHRQERTTCVVDCIKCADQRLMVGLTLTDMENARTDYVGIVYQLDQVPKGNSELRISVMDTITQFKVTKDYVGIQNNGPATPIVTNVAGKMTVLWIECDTFSFDCTRNYIYYNVNQSIFQYDLNKSIVDKFEVTQKIAIDAISDLSNLTPINDRFLLVRSILPNAYSIFDAVDHVIVRSIQLAAGFTLSHVGKLSIVFSSPEEYLVVSFC